jgi:hypothetical protein
VASIITLTKSRQTPGLWRRPEGWGLTASPDAWAILAIAGAVVLANILYLSGVFDPNPLGLASGLGTVTHPGLLAGLSTIDPNNGVTSQTFGHRAVLDWLHLQPPWWNPYEGTGAPLAGEMVSAALFPFTIFTVFANGQLYEHMLFELLAGVSTYLLLRRLEVVRWASTAAAIAFALNGTFAWFTHAPVNPIAFLPLLLLGIETAFSASMAGRSGGWSLIAIAGALSVYAGFPETVYIDALLAALWFAWRCGCATRQHLRAFVTKVAIGAIVAALLAAPLLVAFVDYLSHSYNAHAAIGSVHLPHAALPQLLLPYVYGPIFGFADSTGTLSAIWGSVGGYLSTSLLLFGLLGLVSPGRRGLRVILFSWIVLVVARTYGEPPAVGGVLGILPGMSRVAFFRYADPALELAVVVLAALGMNALASKAEPRGRLLAVTLVSLAVVAAATIGAVPLAHRVAASAHRVYSRGSVLWAVAVVAAGTLAALLPSSRTRRLLAASIVSLDAFVLFVLPELSAPRSVTIDTAPVAYLQRHLGLSRFATLGPLGPNYGSYFGLRSLNTNDALLPSVFASYVNAHLDPAVGPLIFNGTPPGRPPGAPTAQQELLSNLNGYRAAGVRYVLAPAGLELPLGPNTFRIVFRSPTTLVYRLAGASSYFTATNPTCPVQAQSGKSARVSCSTSTTLVRRETYMPGWSAEVDGHARPVREYDDAFQAVTIGPGTHRVTFAFTPPYLGWGLLGFAAGCLCLLAPPLLARTRIRASRMKPPSDKVAATSPSVIDS